MTEERKFAILFAATLLCARKLAQADYERPSPARLTVVDQAIEELRSRQFPSVRSFLGVQNSG